MTTDDFLNEGLCARAHMELYDKSSVSSVARRYSRRNRHQVPGPESPEIRKSVTQDVEPLRTPAAPLRGSLHLEFRRCGKPTCRCANSIFRHGPYYVRRWREGGRQRKALVRPEDVPAVLAAIAERQALGSAAEIVKSLRRARL